MYIDYTFYKDTYGGSALEAEFPKLNIQAQAKVDYFTFGRIKNLNTIPENVKYCVCEVIDLVSDQNILKVKSNASDKRISSETVGSHSVSYKYGDEVYKSNVLNNEELNRKVYEICATYLMNEQNLMYRGLNL